MFVPGISEQAPSMRFAAVLVLKQPWAARRCVSKYLHVSCLLGSGKVICTHVNQLLGL